MRIQELRVVESPHANPQISPPSAGEKDNRNCCVTITAVLHCLLQGCCAFCCRDDKRAKAAYPTFRRGFASFDSGSGRRCQRPLHMYYFSSALAPASSSFFL